MRSSIYAHTCLPFLMRSGIWNHTCLNVCDYVWSTLCVHHANRTQVSQADGVYPQTAAVTLELYEIYFSQICCWQTVFLIMTNRAMDSSLSLLLPCGNSSTCTSCKRRWRVGGLWAVDDQAAWRGQHPEEARGSYEPAPAWVKRANRTYSSINTSPRLLHGIRWFKKPTIVLYFHCTKMQPRVIEDAMILPTSRNGLNFMADVHD